MAKAELPEGVAPDNSVGSSMSDRELRAPDMATPQFINNATANRASNRAVHDDYDEDDEDGDEMIMERSHPASAPGSNNILIMLIFIIALFAIGAGVLIIKNQNTLPLCSTQPDWNQYNCRAG